MRRLVISALVLAACGDNGHHGPDASTTHDGAVDSPPMFDASVCSYTEMQDTTNDYVAMPGAFENTGLTYSAAPLTICGLVNSGHFDTGRQTVDIDNYKLTVSAAGDVIVTLSAPGVVSLSNFNLTIYAAETGQRATASGMFIGDHAVFIAHLAAGSYEFSVEALAGAPLAMSASYQLKISPDSPATRCPQLTTTANYTEAHDGTTSRGNDVIKIDYTAANSNYYSLTPATTDAPEPTGLTLASGTNYRISGTSANVAAVGSYLDADTYLITTGPTTDQLTIRLNWTGANVDLDYYVFDGLLPIGTAATIGNGASELATFAVAPSTAYRLWVGAIDGSTGLPAPYDFSVCAETFTP